MVRTKLHEKQTVGGGTILPKKSEPFKPFLQLRNNFLNHSRKGVKLATLGVVPPSLQFFKEFSRAAGPPEQHVLWKRAA